MEERGGTCAEEEQHPGLVLNRVALRESMTVVGNNVAGGSNKGSVSAGTKPRGRYQEDERCAPLTQEQEVVSRNIVALSIERILGGTV